MSFTAGEILTAAKLNSEIGSGVSGSDTQTTSGTTTSASFTTTLTGGTACGVAFVAPASGKVLISNSLRLAASSSTQLAYCTIRVATGATIGSGTAVVTASDLNAVIASGTLFIGSGRSKLVTGLTSGNSYNVQQWFRSSSGTATFDGKDLAVTPAQ